MDTVKTCTLCDLPLINNSDEISVVKTIGLNSLIKKSRSKNDNKYLLWENKESLEFHTGTYN